MLWHQSWTTDVFLLFGSIGYELHFWDRRTHCCARPILERNHVGCLTYPIQLSRNRRSVKGGKSARPPRPCQAKYLLLPEEIAFDSEGSIRVKKNVLPQKKYNFREDTIISTYASENWFPARDPAQRPSRHPYSTVFAQMAVQSAVSTPSC